jgi:tape measure domain-containing protein
MASSISKDFARMRTASGKFFSFLKTSLNKAKSAWNSMGSVIGKVAKIAAGGGLVVAGVIAGLVNSGLKMQKFRTTLTVVTGTIKGANEELEFLRKLTDRVGISFTASAEPFARFAAAATNIFDKTEIREIFSSFSEASAALHLNQQEINGVFLALQQIASKGKVSMEELRLQLAERIPGAMQLAADSMGLTIDDLESQIKRGLISAEDFLGGFAVKVHEKFGNAADTASRTVSGAFARMQTAVFHASAKIAEGGLLDAMSDGADRLGKFLNDNIDLLEEVGKHLGTLVRKAVDFITNLKEEDVRNFFKSVNSGASATVELFTRIGNSSFFKWIFGQSPISKVKDDLDDINERIDTAVKLQQREWSIGRDTTGIDQRLISLRLQSAQLRDTLDSMEKISAAETKPITTSDIVDAAGGKKTTKIQITDADYQAQLDAIYVGINRLTEPNAKINALLRDRTDLQQKISVLNDKALAQGDFQNISWADRIKAAGVLKSETKNLVALNEKIGKIQTKDSKPQIKRADELAKINRGLDSQIGLLNLYGDAAQKKASMDRIINKLAAKKIVLTEDELSGIQSKVDTYYEEIRIHQELQNIYNETAGRQQSIADATIATARAFEDGQISLASYTDRMRDLQVEQANFNLEEGDGSFVDVMTASMGTMVEGYTNTMVSMKELTTDFLTTFTDGFANSIGAAVVQGDNLRESLTKVATTALQSLISGMIKVGIQMMINASLGQAVATGVTGANAAMAAASAAAWAPAAAMASLASFGANSAPAMAGITATTTMASTLAAVTGFKDGGFTGSGKTDDIAGVVHGQEFVVNADATSKNRSMLEAMNKGDNVVPFRRPIDKTNSAQPASQPNVVVTPAEPPVIRVINVMDPSVMEDYLGSDSGEEVILNTIRNNPEVLSN